LSAELEEGGGSILLGDNTGSGAVRFLVLQFGLTSKSDSFVCTYTVHYIYAIKRTHIYIQVI